VPVPQRLSVGGYAQCGHIKRERVGASWPGLFSPKQGEAVEVFWTGAESSQRQSGGSSPSWALAPAHVYLCMKYVPCSSDVT
jgi:hypothetical protein